MGIKGFLLSGFLGLSGLNAYASCPSEAVNFGLINNKNACALKGVYKSSKLLLTADKVWVLQGGVFIGNDNKENSTLTIEPGTKIVGATGADFLVIQRGSKIFAEGTSKSPIVFTSINSGVTDRGQWGGLIINGNAPINVPGGEKKGEGVGALGTGFYGGKNPADNSGVLKYVVVEYAGFEISPDNELNGIAFQGVGNGTIVDYIQVHKNADDGVEFFGGTVDVKHVLLTGNKDDSMDWTEGWTGRAQFVIVDQFEDKANNGIEADSSKIINAAPRSNPILSNMTFVGTMGAAAKGGSALLLRRGTGAEILNSVFTNFKNGCVDIDDDQTYEANAIVFEGNFVDCDVNFVAEPGEKGLAQDIYFEAGLNFEGVDPMLKGYAPQAGSPTTQNYDVTPLDPWFSSVDYAGAVKNQNDNWYKGWTNLTRN